MLKRIIKDLLMTGTLCMSMLCPAAMSVQADVLLNPLHIATYYGEKPTMLPENVDGEAVTWEEKAGEEFNSLYGTVEVKGKTAGGKDITAIVDIIPADTVYFIDCGTGKDWKTIMADSTNSTDKDQARYLLSETYSAVQALTGQTLRNQYPDQKYKEGDTWGFIHEVTNGRPNTLQTFPNHNNASGFEDQMAVADKYTMGVRASTENNFTYILSLPAGTYTLTAGFKEMFNGSHTRKMLPVLTNADTGDEIKTFDEVSMVNAVSGMIGTGVFNLNTDIKVKINYKKTGGENGLMNWLAVAKGENIKPILNRASLRKTVEEAEEIRNKIEDGEDYASKSVDLLNRMYDQAVQMLADDFTGAFKPYKNQPQIAQTMIDTIQWNLNVAVQDMTPKDYQPDRYKEVPVGKPWLDTEGAVIQAHGGGFLQMEDTDGTPVYYWVGEDKGHNRAAFNGITLYSSKDLVNWDFGGTILSTDYNNIALLPNKVIERPKLLYNEKTEKYVLWAHWESKDYTSSQVCVATSDNVDGPYTFLGHWRPGAQSDENKNWGVYQDGKHYDQPNEDGSLHMVDDYSDTSVWGYASRDMTVFSDGDKAYLASLGRVFKLNDAFTDVDTSIETGMMPYTFPQGHNGWEAPALAKIGDNYVIVASGQSGWSPNQCRYYYTKNIEDMNGWQTNPDRSDGMFHIGNNSTYHSQSTNIMVVNGKEDTSFIYMGDHWVPDAQKTSSYVWLPITVEGADTDHPRLSMKYYSGWSLDAEKGSVKVPEYENEPISKGKTVTLDVEESADYPLTLASDGDYNTYFQPNPSRAPFTYTIDLEKIYNLARFDLSTRLVNGSETYYQFTVETSMDGREWTEQINYETNIEQGFKSDKLIGKGRYVRLNVLREYKKDGSPNVFFGLSEVEVFGYPEETKTGSVKMDNVENVENEAEKEISIPVYVKGIGSGKYRSIEGILNIPDSFRFVGIEATDNIQGGSLNTTEHPGEDGKVYLAYLNMENSEDKSMTISQNTETDAVFILKLAVKNKQEPGSKFQVSFDSFTAKKSIDGQKDSDPNTYEAISFDVTKAVSEISISEGSAEDITAVATELYTGEEDGLISPDKKAVSVVFTNISKTADIKFGDFQLYYNQERSEKNHATVYVGIVNSDTNLDSMKVSNSEEAGRIYQISETGRQSIRFGDTNEDKVINASDAMNILDEWLRNRPVTTDKRILNSNVTADSAIDTSDVLAVVDNFVNNRGFEVVNK